jgi:GxxExxY protein
MLRPLPASDDPVTCAILGAAFEVQRVLGAGFREVFYRDALAIEFRDRRIPFTREVPCVIRYKGRQLCGQHYMDFVCFDEVIVEVKARSSIGPVDHAQVLTYLASSRRPLGLLLNMGGQTLDVKRFIWSPDGRPMPAEMAESSVSKLKG